MRGGLAAGVLACAALIAACAASRTQPLPPAAVPASPAAPVARAGSDAAVDASLVAQGYHVVRTGARVRYCRTQTPTGTAFASTVCLSPEQVEQERRSLKHSQDDLSLPRGITCARKICLGGG